MQIDYEPMLALIRQALIERGESVTIQPIADPVRTSEQKAVRLEINGETVWRFLDRVPLEIGDTLEAGKESFRVGLLMFHTFPNGQNVTFATTRLPSQLQSAA